MAEAAPATNALKHGFRERGAQVTRLEAFVDAAFAFAVTLLVISFDAIPDTLPALTNALKGVPAFALSFAQIALFWRAHVTWSRRYGLDDALSNVLSLALVALVLVYVYPLKILFGTFFSWVTDGWIPWTLRVTAYQDILDMFVIYGIAFSTLALCMTALYARAWWLRAELGLNEAETVATASSIANWAWAAVVGGISILSARLMPSVPPYWLAGLPGMLYFLMNLSGVVSRAAERLVLRRYSPGVS
jgi:uncharacterized membrane protein